jgi:hypothetical protein
MFVGNAVAVGIVFVVVVIVGMVSVVLEMVAIGETDRMVEIEVDIPEWMVRL